MKDPHKIAGRFEVPPHLRETVRTLAVKAKLDPHRWLEREIADFINVKCGVRDLSLQEAGELMNIHAVTVARMFKRGVFNNAYYVSPRCIRIPRADVESFIYNRRVGIQ
jgi:hypothetical protein